MSGAEAAKKTLGLGDDESLDATVQEINALRAMAATRELTADEKARLQGEVTARRRRRGARSTTKNDTLLTGAAGIPGRNLGAGPGALLTGT